MLHALCEKLTQYFENLPQVVALRRRIRSELLFIISVGGEEVGKASHQNRTIFLRAVLVLEGDERLRNIDKVEEQLGVLDSLSAVEGIEQQSDELRSDADEVAVLCFQNVLKGLQLGEELRHAGCSEAPLHDLQSLQQ